MCVNAELRSAGSAGHERRQQRENEAKGKNTDKVLKNKESREKGSCVFVCVFQHSQGGKREKDGD